MSSNLQELQSAAGVPAIPQQGAMMVGSSAMQAQATALIHTLFEKAVRQPRDVNARLKAIRDYGKILEVAEDSQYSFRRGRTVVADANIRIAEIVAANWQNMHYGISELARTNGMSYCEAFALDIENGSYYSMKYVVPHRRDKNDDSGEAANVDLKSDRDIYEMIANMGSRRLREAIFRVVPQFVKQAIMNECANTKARIAQQTPLKERVAKMTAGWESIGVTRAMLALWLKCPVDEMLEQQYQELLGIWRTIKNHEGRIDDFFERPSGAPQAQAATTGGNAGKASQKATDPKPANDGAANQGGNAKQPDVGGAKSVAGGSDESQSGGSEGAGEGAGGAPGFDEIKALIEKAENQDHIDEIQSLLSNNPSLTKTQVAELRGKFKAKVAKMQME